MENKVLATVNGNEITERDIQRNLVRFPQETQEYYKTEEGKKQFLDQIINFELIYNNALDSNMEKDSEYIEQLELMKKDLLIQVGVRNIMAGADVTEEEIKEYYNTNGNMFKIAETVSAKHILVDTLDQIEEAKSEIGKGMSFEEAAQKYSKCPSAGQGGSLGSFTRGRMVPEFEEAAFKLSVGEISEAVKTQFGYHLIQVDEKTPQGIKSLEESKHMIIKNLLQQKQNEKYMSAISELRNKYKVEMK